MKRKRERIGLTLTTSLAYTILANGLVENINGILQDNGRSMIKHSRLKPTFWAEAIWCAAKLHESMVTVEIGCQTPM